jgi:hypothetical protein
MGILPLPYFGHCPPNWLAFGEMKVGGDANGWRKMDGNLGKNRSIKLDANFGVAQRQNEILKSRMNLGENLA